MSNNNTTLAEVVSKPMQLTEHGRYAYWYLRTNWNRALVEGDTRVEYDPPNQCHLTDEDTFILRKALKRVRLQIELRQAQRELTFTRDLAMLVVGYLGKRRFFKTQIRKDYNLAMVMDSVRRNFNRSELLKMGRTERQRNIGNWLRVWEKRLLREAQSRIEQSYYDRLPLYECSGELEAQSLRSMRWCGDRHLSTNRVRSHKTPYWDVGRDGGGQPEIRFRITQKLPEVACNLVSRLGSTTSNGGHIHINCKRDEEIGKHVFFAMRNHLSWFRYLAPLSRRRHPRWCHVQETRSNWSDALRCKFAAISAGRFQDLGTIEVRLWPTSRKPSEWRFRASLMQAIAKWSEDHALCSGDTPISNETAVQAWESFYRWAAIHEPSTLREILKAMKAKARTATNSQRIDRFGAAKCDEFVRQFDASGTRLRGYRRVERQPVTAVCSTDD